MHALTIFSRLSKDGKSQIEQFSAFHLFEIDGRKRFAKSMNKELVQKTDV
ncbi:hypothetical protein G159_07285 [Planococcus glaciei CHR43]|nr:hypothetical protein G159_07285 [Planococcus glaciei CHR43]